MAKQSFAGNVRSAPVWMGDFGGREHLIPFPAKADPAQFSNQLGVSVVVGAAGAAANATSVPVTALQPSQFSNVTLIASGGVLIPKGSTVSLGPVGSKKFVKLTADGKQGDTTLTVEALATALVLNDTGTYAKYGGIFLPSGWYVGRTYAEQAANTPFGPADSTTPDDELYLIAFDTGDLNINNDIVLYRHNSLVKLNYLPQFSVFSANDLAKLRALYKCIGGVD